MSSPDPVLPLARGPLRGPQQTGLAAGSHIRRCVSCIALFTMSTLPCRCRPDIKKRADALLEIRSSLP